MPTDKEFEDFFRQRFDGLEETPPAHAWENIRQQIKPKKRFRWLPGFIFMGLLALATLLPYLAETFFAPNATVLTSAQPEIQPGNSTQTNQISVAGSGESASGTKNQGISPAGNTVPGNAEGTDRTSRSAVTKQNAAAKPANITAQVSGNKKQEMRAARQAQKAEKHYGQAVRKAQQPESRTAVATEKAAAKAAKTARKQYALQAKNAGLPAGLKSASRKNTAKNSSKTAGNVQAASSPVTEYYAAHKNQAGSVADRKRQNTGAANKGLSRREIDLLETRTTNTAAALNKFALPTLFGLSNDSVLTQVIPVDYSAAEENVIPELAISIYGSPRYSSNRLALTNANETGTGNLSAEKGISENTGFEAGATLHKRLAPNTTLDAGINFVNLRAATHFSAQNGTVENRTLQTTAAYGGLRLGLSQGIFRNSGSRIYASAGAGAVFLLNGTSEMYAGGVLQPNLNGSDGQNLLRKNNFHVYGGFGYEKAISRRTAILIEPAVTYYLNSALNKTVPFTQKPVTFGLNLGIKYDL